MKHKGIIIAILTIFVLMSMAGVSASDAPTDSVDTQESGLTSTDGDTPQAQSNDDEIESENANLDVLGTDSGTFSGLIREIGDGGNVTLQHKYYTYDSGEHIGIYIDGSVIDGNGAVIDMKKSGVRAFNVDASHVTIKNLTIKNAVVGGDGGAILSNGLNSTVMNCNFANNEVYGMHGGGAIYFNKDSNIINCSFNDNSAGYGGAVLLSSGIVTDCSFTNNSAAYESGAIGFGWGFTQATVSNCNFVNNSALSKGGAIAFGSSKANGKVLNCNFTGNNASSGSAIYFFNYYSSEHNVVSNSCFLNNRADANLKVATNDNNITIALTYGDNLLNSSYSINDAEVTFTNVAYWSANGIANTGSSAVTPARFDRVAGQNVTLEIYDSGDKLVENVTLTTDDNGQVIYDLSKLSRGKYKYKSYHLSDGYYSYAESNGAFTVGEGDFNLLQSYINAADSVLTLDRNYTFTVGFDENLAEGIVIDKPITINGNGYTINALQKARIFNVNAADVVLNNITFTNAIASGDGGAVHFDKNGTVSNCNFVDNKVTGYGSFSGAVYFGDIYNTSRVSNCKFTNNSADIGGAIAMIGGSVTDCSFTDNHASNGGAIYMDCGSVENCNFVNNFANSSNQGYSGGAIYFDGYGEVINCNFTNNTATDSGGAINMDDGIVKNSNFVDNKATGNKSSGGAVYFFYNGAASNCSFTNNAATDGGAILFTGNGNVTNCSFTNNSASERSGGAILFTGNGNVTNCSFTNNSASERGGAVYFYKDIEYNIINCNFTDNTADYGGAVYLNGKGDVTNCNFTNNTASGDGGAIHWHNHGESQHGLNYNTIRGCSFVNNTANYNNEGGGALYFTGEKYTVTVEDCNFKGNSAPNGGAIYFLEGYDAAAVSNCNFVDNKETGDYSYGGAVYFDSNGEVTNCNFVDNKATGDYSYGGAIYIYSGTVTNCNFVNNSATGEGIWGGAIRMYSGTVSNCNFTDNSASGDGGAINMYSGTVSNCNFVDNKAAGDYSYGGAVYFSSTGTVTNCNFTGNNATHGGAVFFYEDGDGDVTNCNFTGNNATHGGAVFFMNNGNVTNCNFTGNTATGSNSWGGAINMYSGTVSNCNFTDNTATYGGAVYFLNTGNVTNCNFTGNNATGDGGAVYFYQGTGSVTNCNFTGNIAHNGSAIYFYYPKSSDKNIANSIFLNNRADAETLEVTKNDNNITVTFTGNDNLLNAIYSEADVSFTNVTYWGADGIANTGSSTITPSRSNKEAGQNITVGIVVDDVIVLEGVKVTDENGMIVLDIIAGKNYYIGVRHDADSYYTENVTIISNNTKFSVNVTSQKTNNKTVNITAKSNIPNDFIKGNLRFILPNGDEISATYAGNGTWWALHAFDGAGDYKVNASYVGLDNVSVNNATISIRYDASVDVNNKTLNLFVGDTFTIIASTTPEGLKVSYVPDDSGVYSIDENGALTALRNGTGSILIKVGGDGIYAENSTVVNVCVSKIPTEITVLNYTLVLTVGDEIAAGATLTPGDAGNVTFTSSNESVVIVDAEGNVIANGKGQANITVSFAGDDKYAACENKTISVDVSLDDASVSVDNDTLDLKVGETCTINATKSPNTILLEITYKSSDESVATVDKNGIVTAVGEGTAIITVSVGDGEIYAENSTNVTVKVKKSTPKLTAKAKTFKDTDKTKKYTLTLKNSKGKPIANAKVSLKVNGKTYTAKTNSKGQATFKLTKLTKIGTYTATVKYAGDKNYTSASAKAKITVKSTWKTIAKGSKYHSMVKKIQIALKSKGYYKTYNGHYLKVDGIFHIYTEMAVKQFQKASGLKVTGKVDYNTAKKLGITK